MSNKVDVTKPIKKVFGGTVKFFREITLTSSLILFGFFLHGYILHTTFSAVLLASAIVVGLIFVVCQSLESSWFSTDRGTLDERVTMLEMTLGEAV